MLMRGGTSKGVYLLASDLPTEAAERDPLLLKIMGSPDRRQIDGLGGATSLTSKVAMISPSSRPDCDVDYHFAQVGVETDTVDTGPTCGNILIGVGPFAILRGLVNASDKETGIRVWDVNTESRMNIVVQTPGGVIEFEGDTSIDGVPGTAAPIRVDFLDVLGPSSGNFFPTGNPRDVIEGVEVTCTDTVNPVVLVHATDLGETGYEDPAQLDADHPMLVRLEAIRACSWFDGVEAVEIALQALNHPRDYYIDYTLALSCALQFWARSLTDREGALTDYVALCRLGGTRPFQGLCDAIGLRSPLRPGCLDRVVASAQDWLGKS